MTEATIPSVNPPQLKCSFPVTKYLLAHPRIQPTHLHYHRLREYFGGLRIELRSYFLFLGFKIQCLPRGYAYPAYIPRHTDLEEWAAGIHAHNPGILCRVVSGAAAKISITLLTDGPQNSIRPRQYDLQHSCLIAEYYPPEQPQIMEDPKLDPGSILWLPSIDPTNTITPKGRLNHPVLVFSLLPSGVVVCGISSFRSTSLLERFPNQKRLRSLQLPLAPADPHPDTGELLDTVTTGTPYAPSSSKQSYVKLNDIFFVPAGVLEPVYGGTARLTREALATVKRKIWSSRELAADYTSVRQEGQRWKGAATGEMRYSESSRNQGLTYESMFDSDYDVSIDDDSDAADVDENVLSKVLKFITGIPMFIRGLYST